MFLSTYTYYMPHAIYDAKFLSDASCLQCYTYILIMNNNHQFRDIRNDNRQVFIAISKISMKLYYFRHRINSLFL